MEDPYSGQGGSYVLNKKGVRELVERTEDNNRPSPSPLLPQAGEGWDEGVTANPGNHQE